VDRSTARPSSPLAPIPMIGGAAIVLAGSFFPWFAVHTDFSAFGGPGPNDTIVSGLDTSDGKILSAVAIGIAVLGVAVLVMPRRGARIASSIFAAFAGLYVGGVAIYDVIRPEARAIEEFSHGLASGSDVVAVRRILAELFDRGLIQIDTRAGLWIEIVGAAVVVIGAVFSAIRAAPAAAAPPAGSTWEPPSRGSQGQSPPSDAPVAASERTVVSPEPQRAPVGEEADGPRAS
jgi:hypothetical protein